MTDLTEVLARAMATADELDPNEDPNYVDGTIYTQVAHPPGTRLWNRYARKARAQLAALDAAGYQIVPKDFTGDDGVLRLHLEFDPKTKAPVWVAAAPKP
jgi:hypothetical protein